MLWPKASDYMTVPAPHPRLPAEAVFHVAAIPVTNTMLAGWITTVFLVLVTFLATRKMGLIPRACKMSSRPFWKYCSTSPRT